MAVTFGLKVGNSPQSDATETTYAAGTYEIPAGDTLEIAEGATFEIG